VRFASPVKYTPKHIAEKILTSRSALEGERKQVTVLFADMKGSMELLADRDPEEARKLLDPVLDHMMEAVHRYDGIVNQVMGDGIMALFGAPLAQEDHAVRGCYAALRMQDTLKRYAASMFRAHGVPVQVRIGLNSGEVVVRSIGSDLHMDYTAVGQTTHLAARMEQIAIPGTILITSDTLGLAEGFVEVTARGPAPVKGVTAPVEVFELRGANPVRSRLRAAAARGLNAFVGRHVEMDRMFAALELAKAGKAQVVGVVGEPGVGKSRLFWEFTHSPRTRGCLVMEAASMSYGKATSYLPVVDLLKGYFQIEARDDPGKIREKVTGKLLTLDRALESALHPLLALLDVPVEDPQWVRLDPSVRRQRTLEAMKSLLVRESLAGPVILVFEDLHWIDSETQSLLDGLVESLPTIRALVLVSYRPEYEHHWGSRTHYAQLRLDPLPLESATELLDDLLGNSLALHQLRQLLIEQTSGNPFFLEESVGTLIETGVLVGERGAYHLARTVEAITVPPTVQAVLAARIDRLAPEEKRLLQTASVIGTDVPLALLEAIAGLLSDRLRDGLGQLQHAEFLYETQLFPDIEYTFKHSLTHEVAYSSLLHEQRRELHLRTLDAMENLYSSRPPEQAERRAYHASNAGSWERAVVYLRQAGSVAFSHSAYRHAAARFEQALRALEQLSPSPERDAQAIEVRLDLRYALSPLGEFGPILKHLQDAERVAQGLGDDRRLGLVCSSLANYFQATGHLARAVEYGHRALGLASVCDDVPSQVSATAYLSLTYQTLGEYDTAIHFARQNIERLTGQLIRERFGMSLLPAVYSRNALARSYAETGEFAAGFRAGEESVRIAEDLGHSYSLAFALFGLGLVHLRRENIDWAIALLSRSAQISRESGSPTMASLVTGFLGTALAEAGRLAEATASLDEAMVQATALKFIEPALPHGVALNGIAEVALRAGEFERAEESALAALDIFTKLGARGYRAWTLRLVATIACRRGRIKDAEGHGLESLALAHELGMGPLAAHCNTSLAEIDRVGGRIEEAGSHAQRASEIWQQLTLEPSSLEHRLSIGLEGTNPQQS
jgi:class 3 adenylate cyclase/tetratricopeptide (TPR) repeat protein